MNQLDLLDSLYFQFLVEYNSHPEYIYTNSTVCDEYSFITAIPLDQFYPPMIGNDFDGVFIFSDGFNTLEGKL
jgi:hypothetical protein